MGARRGSGTRPAWKKLLPLGRVFFRAVAFTREGNSTEAVDFAYDRGVLTPVLTRRRSVDLCRMGSSSCRLS
jgi:hypothetical protein